MAGTAVWIDVLPNLSGFATRLASGTIGAAKTAGRNAGQAFANGMGQASAKDALAKQVNDLQAAEKQCEKAVKQATAGIAKARGEQKEAALRVQAAEEKLAEIQSKGTATASQVTAAQARLESARTRLATKTAATETAEEQLRAASSGLKATQAQLADTEQKLAAATEKVGSSSENGKRRTGGFRAALDQWCSSARLASRASGDLEHQHEALAGASQMAAGKIGAIAGIASQAFQKVTSTISANVAGAIGRADQMANFPLIMQNLGYSADDAAKSIKQISDSLDGLPTTSSAMTNMVQQLAPLTSNLDEATRVSLAFNNAMLAGGKSTVEQENALTQYTQMLAAGTVDMAAWRSIQAAMPGQLNQMAVALIGAGKNGNDLYDAMKAGTVTFNDFNRALLDLNANGVGEFASFEAQARTSTQGIGTAMQNMTNRVQKAIQKVIDTIGVDTISNAINTFSSGFGAIGDAASQFVSAFAASGLGDMLSAAFNTAGRALSTFATAIGAVFNWVTSHADLVAAGLMSVAGAIAAIKGAQTITAVAGALSTFPQALAGVAAGVRLVGGAVNAMVGGPIGLAIGAIGAVAAALTYFFTQTDTGRQMWQSFLDWFAGAWERIKSGWQSVCAAFAAGWQNVKNAFKSGWDWLNASVIEPFKRGMSAIGDAFSWFYQNVVLPVWEGIKTAFQTAFLAIATTVLLPWKLAFNAWAAVLRWLYENVAKPVWNGIRQCFDAAWQFINTNVVEPFKTAWQGVSDFFNGIGQSLKNVWDGVKNWYKQVWDQISLSVVSAFKTAWQGLSDFFNRVGRSLKNVWDGVANWLKAGWDRISTNVVSAFKTAWQGLSDFFNRIGQSLKNVWDSVKNTFKQVWDWIDTHVLSAFRRGLDALANAAHSMKNMVSSAFNALKDAAARPVKWIVDVVYTNGVQKVWNGIAGAVGLDNLKLPDAAFAYADGGINPGYAPGHDTIPAMTSPGEAWMVPEWTRAVGAGNIYRWNRIARQRGPQAVREDMGLAHFDNGGIAGLWAGIKSGVAGAWDWAKQKAGDIADAIGAFMKDPAAWITGKILDPVKTMLAGIGSGNWGTIVAQMPVRVVTGLIDKAKSAVSAKKATAPAAGGGGQYTGPVGSGVEQWRPLVLQVLSELGQPASWADTVLRRMNQESGGNPNAINNWDSNAAMGDPSRGLMQTIGSTFNAYAGPYRDRGIYDPLANIYAGCAYAIARYGSLAGMNRPGGYATGGIVPTLYDRGGILPAGDTLVANRTRQPELVLTRDQIMQYFTGDTTHERRIVQNFGVKIVRPADDMHVAASILQRTAIREAGRL